MPAFLARRYATAVDVERPSLGVPAKSCSDFVGRDDHPVAIGWRGRRYVVREVLDHWWETAAWWATEAGSVSGLGDDERECWRVEAVAGQRAPVVIELSFRWSTGQWTVTAVGD